MPTRPSISYTLWSPWGGASARDRGKLQELRRRLESNPEATVACVLAGLALLAWVATRRFSFLGGDGEDDQQRSVAVAARLQRFEKEPARARRRRSPLRAAPSRRAFDDPPRHHPAAATDDLRLQVHGEEVTVRDGGYEPQRARAVLDTGNAHMTVIDEAFARRHAIYAESSAFAPLGYTTLRGINMGAETRAPVVLAAVTLRGREFRIRAAVSPLTRMDILVGMDILEALFADGLALG